MSEDNYAVFTIDLVTLTELMRLPDGYAITAIDSGAHIHRGVRIQIRGPGLPRVAYGGEVTQVYPRYSSDANGLTMLADFTADPLAADKLIERCELGAKQSTPEGDAMANFFKKSSHAD